jgi:uncharacterized damage-inducible protein DinB
MLQDMLRHQEWADAEHWRAIESCAAAATDTAVRTRLHHIHLVQHAFAWMVGDRNERFVISQPAEFADLAALKPYAAAYYDRSFPLLLQLTADQQARRINVPWFQDPPLDLRVDEALTQCVMHSHWHRGQNATRLRELGGEPPGTDLITWIWKGRPSATWGR